jgi:hypothetical protein
MRWLQLWMLRAGWECEIQHNAASEARMTAYAEGMTGLHSGWKEYKFCQFKERVNATAGVFVCPGSLHVVRSSLGHTVGQQAGRSITLHTCLLQLL